MDPRILRKQVTDNAEEIRNYLDDLKNWESDMKRLESELQNNASEDTAAPPIRSKKKKLSEEKSLKQHNTSEMSKRISSYDYASWDKFDVDKACEELEAQHAEEVEQESSEDEENLVRQREEAVYEKNMGNGYVKSQKWKEAIQCYSRAITCYPYDSIFYANRALCYLKTGALKSAEADCTAAIQLDANYVKAYQRRASARVQLGQLNEARTDLLKVMELEPKNMASKAELTKIEKSLKLSPGPKNIQEEKEKQDKSIPPNMKKEKKIGDSVRTKDVKARGISKNNAEPTVAAFEAMSSETQQGQLLSMSDSVVEKNHESLIQENADLKAKSAQETNLVHPVDKPPHLRSKKPLKRLEIKEVSSSSVLSTAQKDSGAIATGATNATYKPYVCNTDLSTARSDFGKTEMQTVSTDVTEVPPVPQNSVQFLTAWKKVKTNPISSYYYLKQIPGEALPKIFGDSLETSTLSEMISTLATKFIEEGEKVYTYLHALSRVQRFSALALFLSANDKSSIKKLLNYCEEQGECSPEEAAELRVKYEA